MTCDDCIRYPACVFHLIGHENEKCPNFLNKANLVEVVRCKDCKWWENGKDYEPYCNHCGSTMSDTAENDFCSYGERKEQE